MQTLMVVLETMSMVDMQTLMGVLARVVVSVALETMPMVDPQTLMMRKA